LKFTDKFNAVADAMVNLSKQRSLICTGFKLFIDGSGQNRTAGTRIFRLENDFTCVCNYLNNSSLQPKQGDPVGLNFFTLEQLAHKAGSNFLLRFIVISAEAAG
jgi:hypothetical protein